MEGEIVPDDEIVRMVKVLSIALDDVKRLQEVIQTERENRPKMADIDRARIDHALGVLKGYVDGLDIGFWNDRHLITGLNLSDEQVLELIAMIKGIE